jgi:hypothetical protein
VRRATEEEQELLLLTLRLERLLVVVQLEGGPHPGARQHGHPQALERKKRYPAFCFYYFPSLLPRFDEK